MTDRKKVIEELESYEPYARALSNLTVKSWIVTAVLALLKEQEAVEPHYNARTNWYECGACKHAMTSGMHCKGVLIPAYKVGFCAKCGRAVTWEWMK